MHGVIKANVREVDFPVETFYFEAKWILIIIDLYSGSPIESIEQI